MLLQGLYKEMTSGTASAAVQRALASPPTLSVFEIAAGKQPSRPFLVVNRVSAPPAGETLDGISDLVDGEIQFDSYADTPDAAALLSRAVRDFWLKTFVSGALPDGTTITFVGVTADHDEGYEEGGTGYLYRHLLRLHSFYTEAS